jgi:NADH-quinone oxidoreductase subunit H
LWGSANTGWWPLLWFVIKVGIVMFVFIWLRGTLPRFRYDQFMKFGWKVLIPVNLLWILIEAGLKMVSRTALYIWGGSILALVLIGLFIADAAQARNQRLADLDAQEAAERPFDPFAGGFPIPPMPGQQLPAPRPVPVGVATSGHEITGSLPPHEIIGDRRGDIISDETDESDGGHRD